MRNGGCVTTSPDLVKPTLRCRACGGADLVPYLDLGIQALANAFRKPTDTGPEFSAPLGVQWCPACGLSQLTHVVAPEKLYSHYLYSSGVSLAWRAHEYELVQQVESRSAGKQSVIEIASNDGTLLEMFQKRGHTVLGVEPALNLIEDTTIPTIGKFWSREVAEGIAQFHDPADAVIAQNVFGHVDDALEFLIGVRLVLADAGICIIECPHILALLEQVAVDTIYHEHLSYWGLKPLQLVAHVAGLSVVHVELFPDLHGGTMRYTLMKGPRPMSQAARLVLAEEDKVFALGIRPYLAFARQVDELLVRFHGMVEEARGFGKRVVGAGAAAKGNVLLQASGVTGLDYIADDTPAKQGLVTPGTHIPVQPFGDLSQADVLVLLAWNWATNLKATAHQHGFRGKYLVPVPDPHYE